MNDELQFQDFPHEVKESGEGQTHTFVDFPHSANSDDEDSDRTELLKEEKKPANFWTFEYYQQLFDVDTHQVLRRILGSMTPIPGRNYLTHHIRPNPDLYGPFWICTTLVFTTAIAGNLANYLQSANMGYQWRYNFQKVTFAATAIFCYWWLLPLALFGMMWWRGSRANYSFLEVISVYGYSLAIYIPISILWVIQVGWLQWLLVVVGTVLSGSVLLFTFWPAFKEDTMRVAGPVMAAIFIFHAALAAGFVLYFFYVPAAASVSPMQNMTTTTLSNIENKFTALPSRKVNLTRAAESGLPGTMQKMSENRRSPETSISHAAKNESPRNVQTQQGQKISPFKQSDKLLPKTTKRQSKNIKIAIPPLILT
ncbi:protein YIPF1-like [Gigantopelta aegis]|uniref:protein YIPF1-like n=1 Tax=Gigantopelta aegis TaxID=1735272 RepID=UPI001B88C539|nr:protein YIPF1-like [Gigantopelta aegis]